MALNTRRVLASLVLLRVLNAALVWTFFQPDEYFQSLEPAWAAAFGADSGAYTTWVRPHLTPLTSPPRLPSSTPGTSLIDPRRNGNTSSGRRCTRPSSQQSTRPPTASPPFAHFPRRRGRHSYYGRRN
ncbi:hypothetical protein IMZ48_13960 [Candidatus Bathyarchaeota archaeon]|nr:hypothetical protein [Candidatus Bathyarchaeota archaeon]